MWICLIFPLLICYKNGKDLIFMKKWLSLLVALIVMTSNLIIPVTANAEETASSNSRISFSDVSDDYSYKKAITTLATLNILNGYEDGTFAPNKSITRAEFTKIIVYMLGYGDLNTPITQFADVPQTHWANAHIKVAYDLGIINGFDETTFAPDSPVTYEQALKMIVCTLGYQGDAEIMGGYPVGYQSKASSLELTKGISGLGYSANAPRGVVAQIMYNALEIEIYERQGTSWTASGKNLLNDYLNVYALKGIVVGIEDSTTSDCNATLYPGQMAIDDDKTGDEYIIDYTEYTSSLSAISAYLGQTVQIYYRMDDSDMWLVEIDNETYKNQEMTVYSYQLDEYSNYTIKYIPDGAARVASIKLDKDELTVRYNGRAVSEDVTLGDNEYEPIEALTEWLDPNSDYFIYGTVKLIDSGSTGKYNIVDIYDYETIVALKAPTNIDYRITDKTVTGNYLTLDPDDYDYRYTITKNGKEIETTSIATNDVLNYAISLDGEYYTVTSTAQSITGTITAVNITNDDEKTISIDNTEYRVSDRFINYIETKELKTLSSGVEITAYPDMFGTLEWGTIKVSTEFYPYAYVIDVLSEAEDYYLKLFAPSSTSSTSFSSSTSYKVKTFKIVSSGSKINGKKADGETIATELEANARHTNPDTEIANADINLTGYNQLIRVKFTSAGEIEEVVTLDASVAEGTMNEDATEIIKYKSMDPNSKYYVTSTSIKESADGSTLYSLKSTTPMFVIPKDRTNTEGYSLKSALTGNTMYTGGSWYLEAYDVNDSRYPTCLLVYNSTFKKGTAITHSTAYRLVADNIREELDEEDGDIFKMLYTFNSATTTTTTKISPDYEDLFDDLEMGDVILNGSDGDKYADSIMMVQDFTEIQRILDGDEITVTDNDDNETTQIYNWNETQEQTADNNWQKYVFDFRYPKTGLTEPTDDYYKTGGNTTNIYSRACMFNVIQVLTDENMLYVTKSGFLDDGSLADVSYEEIKISSSTKILRYDENEETFTPYAEGTENTALTAADLKESKNYGQECSKVLITYISSSTAKTSAPTAKFIVIYD